MVACMREVGEEGSNNPVQDSKLFPDPMLG
jgi:hypothetical protein